MDFGFELGRGLVAERGVFPVNIIVGVDVVENLGACVGLIEEAAVLEHLVFESAHQGLGPGVVVGICPGRHALAHSSLIVSLISRERTSGIRRTEQANEHPATPPALK